MKRKLTITLDNKAKIGGFQIENFEAFNLIELLGIAKYIETAATMSLVQSIRDASEPHESGESSGAEELSKSD